MRAIAVCGLWWGQGSRRPAAPARVRCRYSVESELPPPRPPGSYCDASHSDQNNKQHIIYQVSYVSVERWNRPVRRLITVWHTVRPHVSPIRREGAAGTRGRTGIRTAQYVQTITYSYMRRMIRSEHMLQLKKMNKRQNTSHRHHHDQESIEYVASGAKTTGTYY